MTTIRDLRKYGWRRNLPDRRDRKLVRPLAATPAVLPPVVSLRAQMPPVYDQGSVGSCTGNATAAAIDFNEQKAGRPFIGPSRLFVYFNARALESTVASDAGASVRDVIKAAANLGACKENPDWPYDPNKVLVQPPANCYTDAHQALVTDYLSVGGYSGPSVDDLRTVLAGGEPIVFGISVYDSFESDEVAKNGMVPMPTSTETMQGGHCILLVGYDDHRKLFEVRNSWGPGWGDAGYCWFPYAYLSNPDLASDFWVIRNVSTP